ncbi:MAG: hypothetical protein NUW23_02815 [Firmicutes bacterium]|nr:hypothetical protein [Bacillota bacterium]
MEDPVVARCLSRQQEFWRHANSDGALIGLREKWVFPLDSFSVGLPDGVLGPFSFDPADHARVYLDFCRENGFVQGDLLLPATPMTAFPWVEAMCGCEVHYSRDSKVVWAEPWLERLEDVGRIREYSQNQWFRGIVDYLTRLRDGIGPGFPVATTLMRGTGDILAAVRGTQNFVYDMYDSPRQVMEAAEACTEVFIESWKAQTEVIPEYGGGYFCGPMAVWAPGKTIYFQEDVSAILSPDMYRRFFLPFDRILAGVTPGLSLMHLHSTGLHVLDDVVSIEALGCVQVCIDVLGPKPGDLLGEFRRVQDAGKCLMIYGDLNKAEVEILERALRPEGLLIFVVRGIGQS